MIIYLIGVIVAVVMIGRNLIRRNEEEYSGNILCYVFALLSWGIVFIILMAKVYKYVQTKIIINGSK